MRRFSQRSALVTLSEINITPLLDLAFVLLIIFIITTPLLEQSIPIQLPKGGTPDKKIDSNDIRTVEVTKDGKYLLQKSKMNIEEVGQNLRRDYAANPNLIVYIRADELGFNKDVYAIIDRCQQIGISRYSLRTQPAGKRP